MTATFGELARLPGRGKMWLLDISFDNFATVAYRWATHEGDVNGHHYEQRLSGVGNIKRGFGMNHLPAATTVPIVINNVDFAADWMVERTTVASQLLRARFRLQCGLTTDDAVTYQATVVTQQIGEFVPFNRPIRDAKSIQLSLTDDALGGLSDCLIAPSVKDWCNDGGTTTTNSLFTNVIWPKDLDVGIDYNSPVPIQLGRWPYEGLPIPASFDSPVDFDLTNWPAGERHHLYPIVILATRSTASLTTEDVTSLRVVYQDKLEETFAAFQGIALPVPETFVSHSYVTTRRIWKSYKTQTITKDGYDWKLLWLAFNVSAYDDWFTQTQQHGTGAILPSAPLIKAWSGLAAGGLLEDLKIQAFSGVLVAGSPGSGVVDGSADPTGIAVNVLKDMVESYSSLGVGAVDGPRFARAGLGATHITVRGAITGASAPGNGNGSAQSARVSPYGVGALRQAISDLTSTADIDIFMTMQGKVGFVVQSADFQSATDDFPVFYEEEINNVTDKTPNVGDRWAPYNRVYVMTESNSAGGRGLGPYDNTAAITEWGEVLAKTLPSKWWLEVQGGKAFTQPTPYVWSNRNLESVIRPILTFTSDLSYLSLELGDYFLLPWTRGGQNAAYALTLWRLEAINIAPTGEVSVTAVWMENLRTDHPYLLDNEALVVRAAVGFADSLTVTTGSTTISRSSGSFITDAVAAGDIIRIRDTSEALTGFTRNVDVRVVSVTDATHVVVNYSAFGTAGAHVVAAADWEIYRGATTYPDAVSDAANYPSGGLMYGKVSSVAGVFSDSSPGNKLLDG